jgi:hypothetical protein
MKHYYHQKGVEIAGFPPPYPCQILEEQGDHYSITCPLIQDYYRLEQLIVPKETVFTDIEKEESQ